ncbi:Spy/CpxP family protein refolding chaperone [Roseateles sp.]|uniref:Spy/CpxP family protein refolding chaperone n=1 Tax=Roseateles sp. TaxID=1971397 RepID=UPI003BA67CA5
MGKLFTFNSAKQLSLVALLSLAAAAAQAMGPMGGGLSHRGGGADMMMAGRMERLLEDADASEAQRAQIKQIMNAAKADLKNQRDAGRQLREQAMALFTAPNVDAGAVEVWRQQMQSQRETASKRMTQAMVEAAGVLSPEQRAKLAERMKKMQARMAEHRHGEGRTGR